MAKFNCGMVLLTNGVRNLMLMDNQFIKFVNNSFERHINGDWGDLDEEDKSMNDNGLKNGDDRLFSKYNYNDDTSIYIITEWDRSATTVLFPDEY